MLLHNNLLPITSMRSNSHPSALRQSVSPPPPPSIHPSMQSIHPSARAPRTKKAPASLTVIVFVHVDSQECRDGPTVGVSVREDAWSRAESSVSTAIVSSFPPLDTPACAPTDRWHSRSLVMLLLLSEAMSMEAAAVQRAVEQGGAVGRTGTELLLSGGRDVWDASGESAAPSAPSSALPSH